MCGDDVMWVPGLDHAGIATQSVVERQLQRDEGSSRHDLGREPFLKRVWAWHDEYGSRINDQLRRMGSLLDWDVEYFTMDGARAEAVVEAFVVRRRSRQTCGLSLTSLLMPFPPSQLAFPSAFARRRSAVP